MQDGISLQPILHFSGENFCPQSSGSLSVQAKITWIVEKIGTRSFMIFLYVWLMVND